MSGTEGDEEGTGEFETFNFDDWANGLGLKRPVTQTLRNEDLTTKETLLLLEPKDLKELGMSVGTIKLLQREIEQWKLGSKEPQAAADASIEKDVSDLEENTDILKGAGKTFDVLFGASPPPPATGKTEIFGQMDPRTILTLKSQTNKAIHITQFLTEKSKRRRQNKRKEFILKSGTSNPETLILKADDEHPYLGIYMEEWGAANMRLVNHLLATKKLRREDIEFYLAYTTKIYELAEKYEWNSVLNYDYAYRELQAEHQFQWGTFSPSMELQLLVPKRTQQINKPGPQTSAQVEDCKIFKAKGSCPFGASCRYRHPKTKPPADNHTDPSGSKNW